MMLLRLKGRPSTDSSATARLGVDAEVAIHHLQSFSHAYQPQAAVVDGVLLVETDSSVTHRELNLFGCTAQFHLHVVRATMLRCILQGFLKNPEHDKRDVFWCARRLRLSEFNLHVVPLRELLAEAAGRCSKA